MKKLAQTLLALVLVFGLSGCDLWGFLDDTLEEQDLGVKFDAETGQVSFNLKGGEKTENSTDTKENSDLPQGWDSVIVIYPGSTIADSSTTTTKTATTANLTLLTTDSLTTVRDFYRGVLVAGGYTLSADATDTQVNATKDTKKLTLSLSLKGEQTQAKMVLEY